MQISKLIEANIHSLEVAEKILLDITDYQYRVVAEPFSVSLGKHLRHITDHYQQLLAGLPQALVEYDRRERLETEENERSAMLMRLRSISYQLSQLSKNFQGDQPLSVCLALEEDGDSPVVPSTLSRELLFLQSHSIHHYAIISAILKLQHIDVEPDFGIAPSTLKYEKEKKCAP
ncbi:MAG: hypothetical protein RLN96_08565 [Pseudomonadales bacterium]